MIVTDSYTWLKGLHVAAAFAFASGTLASAVFVSTLKVASPAPPGAIAVARRWERGVTTPTMLATWILGLTLATKGGWFTSLWLLAKLAFVVVLSAVHGIMSARLRRAAAGMPPPKVRWPPVVIVCSAAAIALLAVVKPF